jgi:hypothetical protein
MLNSARPSCLICGSQQLQPFLNLSEMGTSHGAAAHQFTHAYQIIVVCGTCRHGQLEKYSHDCFHSYGDEDWEMYWWYALGPNAMQHLRDLLIDCLDRLNVDCDCAVHRSLRVSAERLWGGVKHAVDPVEKVKFAWLLLEEQLDHVTLKVDRQKSIGWAV